MLAYGIPQLQVCNDYMVNMQPNNFLTLLPRHLWHMLLPPIAAWEDVIYG